jgi:hypothetical protein
MKQDQKAFDFAAKIARQVLLAFFGNSESFKDMAKNAERRLAVKEVQRCLSPKNIEELEEMMSALFPGSSVECDHRTWEVHVKLNKFLADGDDSHTLHDEWKSMTSSMGEPR